MRTLKSFSWLPPKVESFDDTNRVFSEIRVKLDELLRSLRSDLENQEIGVGVIDHNNLKNLADNDHTQYVNAVGDTSSLDLTLSNQQITGTVVAGGVNHDSLGSIPANDHIDHTTVDIIAGTGLSGGGSIEADVTVNCDITQYTDEMAQDAVGLNLSNTATIDLTYTDATPDFKADLNSTLKTNYDAAYTQSQINAFGDIHAYDEAATITIGGTGIGNKVQVDIFDTDTAENNIDSDHTNNHIKITQAGHYLCMVSLAITSAGAGGSDEIGVGVFKNNGDTIFQNCHTHRKLSGGGTDEGSLSISGIINLAVDDTIEVWVWNEDSSDNLVIDDITLSLVQVGG